MMAPLFTDVIREGKRLAKITPIRPMPADVAAWSGKVQREAAALLTLRKASR